MQPKVKEALHDIWQAETREDAYKAFVHCIERFNPKYPGAMNCLAKDKASMLAFYDYPAENWQHIRTTNPIESVFTTVRLRTAKTKNCGSRITTLMMSLKPPDLTIAQTTSLISQRKNIIRVLFSSSILWPLLHIPNYGE